MGTGYIFGGPAGACVGHRRQILPGPGVVAKMERVNGMLHWDHLGRPIGVAGGVGSGLR